MTKQDQIPDELMLQYHGREHQAVRCGRHKHDTLYMLMMSTSKAIVTPARRNLTAPVKARGVVLHAATSLGVKLDVIEAITWDGPAAEGAKHWAVQQCRETARNCSQLAREYRAVGNGDRENRVLILESQYTAMAARLGETQ